MYGCLCPGLMMLGGSKAFTSPRFVVHRAVGKLDMNRPDVDTEVASVRPKALVCRISRTGWYRQKVVPAAP